MSNRLSSAMVGLIVVACLSQPAFAQRFLPGPVVPTKPPYTPTVGDIQHQTVSPYNPSRTDIGIGESVNCWIDPATWQDTDIYIDQYGHQSDVSDTMGTITWSANGAGSVYPMLGNSTKLTADLADANGTVTVQATIPDSGTKGLDAALVKTVAFAIFAPTGEIIISEADNNTFGTAPPPAAAVIGFQQVFQVQIQPITVDFGATGGNVTFRENLPGDLWTWPNGRLDGTPPDVSDEFPVGTQATLLNRNKDTITSGPYPIALLAGQAFKYTIRVPLEYLDGTGHWVGFFPNETHDKSYRTTLDGRGADNANNSVVGGWNGPWASIP